eukprot:scaffold281437_cov31-Attheya_sp.AAC.1
MPTPESAEAWQELSHLVGVGRRCIRHTDIYYTNATVDEAKTPKSTTTPKLTRQKKRIYELLVLVTLGKIVPGRKMETNTFFQEIDNLTTKLEKPEKTTANGNVSTSDPMRDAVNNVMETDDAEMVEVTLGSGAAGRTEEDIMVDNADDVTPQHVRYMNGDAHVED